MPKQVCMGLHRFHDLVNRTKSRQKKQKISHTSVVHLFAQSMSCLVQVGLEESFVSVSAKLQPVSVAIWALDGTMVWTVVDSFLSSYAYM